MTTRRVRGAAAPAMLLASLALALSACSSDDATVVGSEDVSSTPSPGPLEAMMTEALGEFDVNDSNAIQSRMEQAVAECMAAEGWEYTPVDYSQAEELVVAQPAEGPVPGTTEYAEASGYGISTWEDVEVGEETDDGFDEDDGSEWFDPNADYVASLSETARHAYEEALHGPMPTEEEMLAGDFEYDPENSGCYGSASTELYGGGALFDEANMALFEEMNRTFEALESDPRIAAAQAEWGSCMAEAGYPGLASSDAAKQIIMDELDALWTSDDGPGETELAPLREKERAIATADVACATQHGLDAIRTEIQHEAEQAFIETHRTELEAFVTALKAQQESARG